MENSQPSEPVARPRIPDEEAARLVDTYEPTTLAVRGTPVQLPGRIKEIVFTFTVGSAVAS